MAHTTTRKFEALGLTGRTGTKRRFIVVKKGGRDGLVILYRTDDPYRAHTRAVKERGVVVDLGFEAPEGFTRLVKRPEEVV